MRNDALIVIAAMALITFLTRIGGVYMAARFAASERFERIARTAAASVLAAIVATAVVAGDGGRTIGVVAAATVMIVTRRPVAAMAAGVSAAILFRSI